jgi:hypothetical protein
MAYGTAPNLSYLTCSTPIKPNLHSAVNLKQIFQTLERKCLTFMPSSRTADMGTPAYLTNILKIKFGETITGVGNASSYNSCIPGISGKVYTHT